MNLIETFPKDVCVKCNTVVGASCGNRCSIDCGDTFQNYSDKFPGSFSVYIGINMTLSLEILTTIEYVKNVGSHINSKSLQKGPYCSLDSLC